MSSLKIKQINNAGIEPDSCIAFDGYVNVWRKMYHVVEFNATELDANNALTITHSLGRKYVAVAVYDDQDMMLIPDQVKAIDANTTKITFTSYLSSIADKTWTVSIS